MMVPDMKKHVVGQGGSPAEKLSAPKKYDTAIDDAVIAAPVLPQVA